jgi:hypothetical protein
VYNKSRFVGKPWAQQSAGGINFPRKAKKIEKKAAASRWKSTDE